ncbi:hypothetical protein SNE40_013872 [Patella caerulea]|uniref:MACPF domain-containing protein n=1 Tax=Patella caerulea TaxID=87958 RepID=A0AAN8JGX7_PATCE
MLKVYQTTYLLSFLCVLGIDSKNSFTVGDYRYCSSMYEKEVHTFEVLPIFGWDNLRNVEAGVVLDTNYAQCKLTEDGKYLVPDNVHLSPVKTSKVHAFAELIMNLQDYSSVTAKTINVEAGFSYRGVSISGSFSHEYRKAKVKQQKDKTYITRVELRYIRYIASRQPNALLHPSFKSVILQIAHNLQLNQTNEARYRSELLVRDFGTHVLTKVHAGAALVKEDFISQNYVKNSLAHVNDIKISARADFFGIVNVGSSYSTRSGFTHSKDYENSKVSSDIETYGGSIYGTNYTANAWVNSLDNNLVAMDRSGDPIYHLINSNTLPELPVYIIKQLHSHIKAAVEEYYEYNTYRGCLEPESPNFAFQANLDDGSCKSPLTNLSFGGVFQVCHSDKFLCLNKYRKNPKTRDFTCPSNYKAVLLHKETLKRHYYNRACRSCGFWGLGRCCKKYIRPIYATISSFWCFADGSVPQNSGYLFGGFYTFAVANPLTEDKTCPKHYYPEMVGQDLKICLSDDYVSGAKAALPFGGFFSCNEGNPLAMKKTKPGKLTENNTNTLSQFHTDQGETSWPKSCPGGFSAQIVLIDKDCPIHVCIVTRALSAIGLQPIRRPPFSLLSELEDGSTSDFTYNENTRKWIKGAEALNSTESDAEALTSTESDASLIVVSVLLSCVSIVLVVIVIVHCVRRRSKQNPTLENSATLDTDLSDSVC